MCNRWYARFVNAAVALVLALGVCMLPVGPVQAYTAWKAESYNDAGQAIRPVYGSFWLAQIFRTMHYAHNVSSVKLDLSRVGSPGTLTVSIRATSGGKPTGADLASGSTDGNTLAEYAGSGWREVTFSSPASLSANTDYAIVIRATGGYNQNWVYWWSTYPTGSGLSDSSDGGVTWLDNYYYGDTAGFEVWSTSQPPNVPPVLSSPQVIPATGLTTDDIYYYVHYYDPDAAPDDPPSVKTVMIDYVDHTMSLLSGTASNGNYVYGPVHLPYDWIHRYSFHFEDARGGAGCMPTSCSAFYVGPYVTIPLGEALDNTAYTWTTGGDSTWIGQSDTTHDGVDAALGDNITDEQAVWLQTTVNGPGTLSFWWKVSSEPTWDVLTFYIDGAQQNQISGEAGWEQKTYDVNWGPHTLKWEYSKDRDSKSGSDSGWVDQFQFTHKPGRQELAIFRPSTGMWYIDLNHNGHFDPGSDVQLGPFGTTTGDVPVAIDWDGDGRQELAIFRTTGGNTGRWYIDTNRDGTFQMGVDTLLGPFGSTSGDVPVAIDWNGDEQQEAAIFRQGGTWFIDANHSGVFNPGVDYQLGPFGKQAGDIPLSINWNGGNPTQELVIFRPSTANWFIDTYHDGIFNSTYEPILGPFGKQAGDVPVAIDWDGDGRQELAIFRSGTWFIDLNHNGVYEAGIDLQLGPFGQQPGDRPLAIDWDGN